MQFEGHGFLVLVVERERGSRHPAWNGGRILKREGRRDLRAVCVSEYVFGNAREDMTHLVSLVIGQYDVLREHAVKRLLHHINPALNITANRAI